MLEAVHVTYAYFYLYGAEASMRQLLFAAKRDTQRRGEQLRS